jgi:hypothetical protein
MASYTLRPNANWNGDTLFTGTGGSDHAVLADDTDSTFILRTSTTVPAAYEAEFTTTTLSADETITSVNLRARISAVAADSLAQFSIGVITDRNGRAVSYGIPVSKQGVVAATTYDLGIKLTSAPNGATWTQTLLDNLVVKFTDGATGSVVLPPDPTNRTTLYALYIDVETAPRPTVTVTAPTGTVTDTSFPSVTWTPVFSDGSPQSAYEIKIFDAATYGGASFSPDTSTPIIGTGVITSTNNGQTLEGDLANSTTYRAYVRVASLINGNNYFSAWAFSQFALAIDSPATPTVSAFYDSNTGAVTITIFGRTNALDANQASFETDTSGWVAAGNCAISRTTSQFSNGAASLALVSSSAGDMSASTTSATKFPVSANNKFSATAEFKASATARSCSVGIIWLNTTGTVLSTVFGTAENNSTSAWNECNISATAPATATHAQVIVKVASAGSTETHYVDKVAFHAGDNPFWTRGGFDTFSFVVERSEDAGVTYAAVRNSPVTAAASQIATLNDFEVPLDKTVIYRAKARAEI